jgi:hypothetical protein
MQTTIHIDPCTFVGVGSVNPTVDEYISKMQKNGSQVCHRLAPMCVLHVCVCVSGAVSSCVRVSLSMRRVCMCIGCQCLCRCAGLCVRDKRWRVCMCVCAAVCGLLTDVVWYHNAYKFKIRHAETLDQPSRVSFLISRFTYTPHTHIHTHTNISQAGYPTAGPSFSCKLLAVSLYLHTHTHTHTHTHASTHTHVQAPLQVLTIFTLRLQIMLIQPLMISSANTSARLNVSSYWICNIRYW